MAIWWLSWQPKLSNVNLLHNLSLFSISHQELTIKLKIKMTSFSRSVVRDLDPTNELTFLRVKSLKYEVKSLNIDRSHIMVFKQKNEKTDQRCWLPQSQTSWWLCFKAGMHNARTRIIRSLQREMENMRDVMDYRSRRSRILMLLSLCVCVAIIHYAPVCNLYVAIMLAL